MAILNAYVTQQTALHSEFLLSFCPDSFPPWGPLGGGGLDRSGIFQQPEKVALGERVDLKLTDYDFFFFFLGVESLSIRKRR